MDLSLRQSLGISIPGESIIHKRAKVRGNGKAVQFRFEAEPGNDLRLLGYSVSYTMRGKY